LTGILIPKIFRARFGEFAAPRPLDDMSFTDEALSCLATKFSMEPVKSLLTVIFLLSGWAMYLHIVKWCI
jgi:hypothetical protein